MFLHIAYLYQKIQKLSINWYAPVLPCLCKALYYLCNLSSSVQMNINEHNGYYKFPFFILENFLDLFSLSISCSDKLVIYSEIHIIA